jgi:hypothetical protein
MRLLGLLFCFLLCGVSAHAANWGAFAFDDALTAETKADYERASNAVDALLAAYRITLKQPVTAVVTADTQSYIRALMQYGGMNRAEAEAKAINDVVSLGLSTGRPVILIRWIPSRVVVAPGQFRDVRNPAIAFTLAHEMFHQVALQYRRSVVPVWLNEGPAQIFRYLALEQARLKDAGASLQEDASGISRAQSLPDVRDIDTTDYAAWRSLVHKGYPVYSMATVMTGQLVGQNGFRKIIDYYELLAAGAEPDEAFSRIFGVSRADFLDGMNAHFAALRR